MKYDSTRDTIRHAHFVHAYAGRIIRWIRDSLAVHDMSKLFEPEKSLFDEYTPELRHSEYGSQKYKECLEDLKPALDNHYAKNRHHPEHFENGIAGMTLMDLVEMLADWKASTRRHESGDIHESLKLNRERFGIEPQLHQILLNTVEEMGW